jgi:formate dehydrogenase subunit gamma
MKYTFNERVVHAIVAASFAYLMLTGLAFWTPALYWIATVLGGGFLVRAMHPWVGLIFAVAVAWMFVSWSGAMRITDADRLWRRSMWHYIRNEDDRMPAIERFNYGQKMLFWVMAAGALLLLISGLVLWAPHLVPGSLALVRQIAMLVHAAAALVTIGALIVHIYMGVIVVPGGLAIVHGGARKPDGVVHH